MCFAKVKAQRKRYKIEIDAMRKKFKLKTKALHDKYGARLDEKNKQIGVIERLHLKEVGTLKKAAKGDSRRGLISGILIGGTAVLVLVAVAAGIFGMVYYMKPSQLNFRGIDS